MSLKNCFKAVVVLSGIIAGSVQSAEVSLMSGFYKSEEKKDDVDKKVLSLGGRFFLTENDRFQDFVVVGFEHTTLSGNKGGPSSLTGIEGAYGKRWYILDPHSILRIFAEGYVGLRSGSEAYGESDELKYNAIVYGGDIGLRADVHTKFFVEMASSLFESSLYRKEVVEGKDGAEDQETTKTEIYVKGSSFIDSIYFSVGMRL